jgi:hypothetical protein
MATVPDYHRRRWITLCSEKLKMNIPDWIAKDGKYQIMMYITNYCTDWMNLVHAANFLGVLDSLEALVRATPNLKKVDFVWLISSVIADPMWRLYKSSRH